MGFSKSILKEINAETLKSVNYTTLPLGIYNASSSHVEFFDRESKDKNTVYHVVRLVFKVENEGIHHGVLSTKDLLYTDNDDEKQQKIFLTSLWNSIVRMPSTVSDRPPMYVTDHMMVTESTIVETQDSNGNVRQAKQNKTVKKDIQRLINFPAKSAEDFLGGNDGNNCELSLECLNYHFKDRRFFVEVKANIKSGPKNPNVYFWSYDPQKSKKYEKNNNSNSYDSYIVPETYSNPGYTTEIQEDDIPF